LPGEPYILGMRCNSGKRCKKNEIKNESLQHTE
jgi:hypothetical protein